MEWAWVCGSLIVLGVVKLFPTRNVQEIQVLIASDFHQSKVLSDSIIFVTSILLLVNGVVNF